MKYHVARNGQQLGVFLEYELRAKLQTGELLSSDLFWTEGMADWQPLANANNLAGPVNPYAPPSVDVSRPLALRNEANLASLGQRLGAAALNLLTVLVVGVPCIIGAVMMDEKSEMQSVGIGFLALGGLAFVALIIYNIVLLATRGQSLGKKWMSIRIVDFETGGNPGFVKIFLLRYFVNALISNVIPFYGIVDICFIFREDRRCIHDLMAGTHVVQGDPPES